MNEFINLGSSQRHCIKSGFFVSPPPPNTPSLEASVLTLLQGGGTLKSAIKISSHRLQINELDICIMKGWFIF